MTYLNKRLMVQTSGIRKDVKISSWKVGWIPSSNWCRISYINWMKPSQDAQVYIYIYTIPDAPWDWNTYQHLTKNLFQPHGVNQPPKTLQTMGNVSVNRWDVNHYVECSSNTCFNGKSLGLGHQNSKEKDLANYPGKSTCHLKGTLAKWKGCLPSRIFQGKAVSVPGG